MKLNEVIELDKKHYMNVFGDRLPVCFEYGKGMKLWDTNGKEYYDFFSGIAVNSVGHSHEVLNKALKEQIDKYIHCSNLFYIDKQALLASKIVEKSCADRVFFANSGAEANEGAIKLARIYSKKNFGPEKFEIITLTNSFHGRTLTTVSATGQAKYQEPFTPLTPGFKHVEINNIDELEKAITSNTCAIMLELVQGESGVHPLSQDYLNFVKKLANKNQLLLIFDEIQTGMGRTGKYFAYEHYGIEPDIFTLAKGLGGGFPIGAVCAKESIANAFKPGDHGSTFGGNPLACAAGLAIFEILENENLVYNANEIGNHFLEKLSLLQSKLGVIKDCRGLGLLIGIEFNSAIAIDVRNKCLEKGFIIGSIGTNTLRIAPPLIVSQKDFDSLLLVLYRLLAQYE